MTSPEEEPKLTNSSTTDSDDRKRPKKEVTLSSTQELFSWIKLRRLMENEAPGSSSLTRLREIQEQLESPDAKIKLEANNQLQEILRTKGSVEGKANNTKTVGGFLQIAKIDEHQKSKLQDKADHIDRVFAKAEAGTEAVGDDEINQVHAELQEVAKTIGIRENSEGMEEAMSRLHWMQASKDARQFVQDHEVYTNPVEEYGEEFKPGGSPKILKLTDVDPADRDRKQRKLDLFRERVSKELVEADPRVMEDLSADDLIKRLEETTHWQANIGDLQGRKKWQGNEKLDKIRDVLGRVEAQYQALLEAKMVKELVSKHTDDHLNKDLIRESVVQSLHKRRRYLRTEYDFDKNVPAGKRRGEVLEEEVFSGAKKMQTAYERHEPRYVPSTGRSPDGGEYIPPPGSMTKEQAEEHGKRIVEMQEKTTAVMNKLGIDTKMAKALKKSSALREEVLKKAEATLTPSEMETFSHSYNHWERSVAGMRGELSAKQDELEALKGSKQYSKFLIKFKAYVERVGLREASSDWDFAIMMREAKEEISLIHPDAGEKLDQWQEALFAPGLASVDEKSFFEVMPKIMTQSRLEHEFSPQYANWEAMQVTGADGKKKVISVAAFHQLLQREDNAKRILNAVTNGNDSMIHQILVEHIWGPNAKLETMPRAHEGLSPKMKIVFSDGRQDINTIDVTYFDLQTNKFNDSNTDKKMAIEDFVDQSMWMTHYAKTLWSFSGDWEPFVRDFPADQLTQANKRLANIGQAFRDYGLDYGKFDMGYVELAKAGVLLQPFSTYKIGDVVKSNLRRMLFDKGIEPDYKKGDIYAAALADAIQKRAFISDEYKPVVSMRSVSEMRLMGFLPGGDSAADIGGREQLGWEWFKKNQEILGRKGILSLAEARGLKNRYLQGESLSMDEEGWAVQLIEINKLTDDLLSQRKMLESKGIPTAVLKELMDKQSLLTTGELYDGPVNLETYLKNFEFSSIVDHAQLKKGTDPIDYKNYSDAKQAAAKLMTEVLSGSPTLEKINELYNTMKTYMPPEQLMGWFEEYMKTRVRLRTNQVVAYEIAMTDLELWKMQNPDLVRRGVKPPSTIMGINPVTYKIKDERGDNWNVIGADGFRVSKKKWERGNHMWKTRELPGLTASDIETEMKLYVGNRWLPNKEVGHRILEDSMGLSQTINRFYKNMGRPELADKGFPKFMKKYGSKLILILRKHPLFDDPSWAFWSILNEYYEYSKEVNKEMQKAAMGGN